MKKIIKFVFIFMILFATSCAGGNMTDGGHPNIDGTSFTHYKQFEFEEELYDIYLPTNANDATFYIYEETEYKSSAENWTINYYRELNYFYDNNLGNMDGIISELINVLLSNIEEVETRLNEDLNIENIESLYDEVTLKNNFNSEVSCVFFDKYISLRLENMNDEKSTISLPIGRKYLLKADNLIQSPFEDRIITWEDFLVIPNIRNIIN